MLLSNKSVQWQRDEKRRNHKRHNSWLYWLVYVWTCVCVHERVFVFLPLKIILKEHHDWVKRALHTIRYYALNRILKRRKKKNTQNHYCQCSKREKDDTHFWILRYHTEISFYFMQINTVILFSIEITHSMHTEANWISSENKAKQFCREVNKQLSKEKRNREEELKLIVGSFTLSVVRRRPSTSMWNRMCELNFFFSLSLSLFYQKVCLLHSNMVAHIHKINIEKKGNQRCECC